MFFLPIDFPFIECIPITLCIAVVLAQCGGEVVCAREILLCAHIEIVVVRIVEYCIQPDGGWNAYRTGREPLMQIGVVRRLYLQMLIGDAS